VLRAWVTWQSDLRHGAITGSPLKLSSVHAADEFCYSDMYREVGRWPISLRFPEKCH
jgi:hypothetical protein